MVGLVLDGLRIGSLRDVEDCAIGHQTKVDERGQHLRLAAEDRNWQYSHFAALWEMTTPHQRVIFCQQCAGVTPATDGLCVGCGTELFDPFAIPSHAEV